MALPKIQQPLFNYTLPVSGIDITFRPFLVSEEKIHSNTTLDLNTLDKGVYFVNISNNETQHITKVVIE